MLSVAVHGVTKNILDFVYFLKIIFSFTDPVQSLWYNPKLMSCGQLKIISET